MTSFPDPNTGEPVWVTQRAWDGLFSRKFPPAKKRTKKKEEPDGES